MATNSVEKKERKMDGMREREVKPVLMATLALHVCISLELRAIHEFIFITSLTIASKRKSPTFSASHTIIFM